MGSRAGSVQAPGGIVGHQFAESLRAPSRLVWDLAVVARRLRGGVVGHLFSESLRVPLSMESFARGGTVVARKLCGGMMGHWFAESL